MNDYRLSILAGCVFAVLSNAGAAVTVDASGSILAQKVVTNETAVAPGAVTLNVSYQMADPLALPVLTSDMPSHDYLAEAPTTRAADQLPSDIDFTASFDGQPIEAALMFEPADVTPVPQVSPIFAATVATVALLAVARTASP